MPHKKDRIGPCKGDPNIQCDLIPFQTEHTSSGMKMVRPPDQRKLSRPSPSTASLTSSLASSYGSPAAESFMMMGSSPSLSSSLTNGTDAIKLCVGYGKAYFSSVVQNFLNYINIHRPKEQDG